MTEIWKDIQGYEGLYQISNLGRVKSLSREVKTGVFGRAVSTRIIKEHILKGRFDKDGYYTIYLSHKGKAIQYKIHRLVAIAFLEPIEGKELVNHINGIKNDNRLNNLEWCTNKENLTHAHNELYDESHIYYNSMICIREKDGEIVEFSSIRKAAISVNGSAPGIIYSMKRKAPYKGFNFSAKKQI